MPTTPAPENKSDYVGVIGAVKTYLGFFVLLVLVVEGSLGVLAATTKGQTQFVALISLVGLLLVFIAVIVYFAGKKPEALLQTVGSLTSPEAKALQTLCRRISGQWWERIKPDNSSAISVVAINADPATRTVKMKGVAYDRVGTHVATWESRAACINTAEAKVFYYWQGLHPANPSQPFEGFGEISFTDSKGGIEAGEGYFSDTNVTDMTSTTKKAVRFRRGTPSEARVMRTGGGQEFRELIRRKLEQPI